MRRLRWREASEPIDVLAVCTGNLCRSPMIEALLRARLPALLVASAGTGAPEGASPPLEVEQVLATRGVSVAGHRAHQLGAAQVRASRLIVTATVAHRTACVVLDPSAQDRAYTLLELARLLGQPPAAGHDGTPAGVAAAAARALAADRSEHDDDLGDPIGLTLVAYERCLATIETALGVLVPALGG